MTNTQTPTEIDFAYFCDLMEDHFIINDEKEDMHSVYHELHDEYNKIINSPDWKHHEEIEFFIENSDYWETHFTYDHIIDSRINDQIFQYWTEVQSGGADDEEEYEDFKEECIVNVLEPYFANHPGWKLDIITDCVPAIMEVYGTPIPV